jgi:O-antigen ligase
MSLLNSRLLPAARKTLFSYAGLTALFFCCLAAYLKMELWWLLLVPFGVCALFWALQDFKRLYFLVWATIPFSIEIDLPGGLSTDFPAEPLMWLSCLMLVGYIYLYHKELDFSFLFHPVFIALMVHFSWILLTTVISTQPLISFKYSLAKSWYIVTFVLIPLLVFRNLNDFRQWILYFLIPVVATVLIVLVRHSATGFSFSTINAAVMPIYRNHVDYACLLGVLVPFLWINRKWIIEKIPAVFLYGSVALMLAGIYFSYTRAAWLCIPLAAVAYYLIRLRLMRVMITAAVAGVLLLVGLLAYDNAYLDFAPDYEKAITHEKFDDLISATYKMEDISTVERFYRWVAGYYMIQEKPLIGFGPSSFYSNYHSYADRHFITYVSDNPERSGMHNYYLMVAVEQGLPGLAIFLLLLVVVLLYGERLFHSMDPGPGRQLLIAALVAFCCNLFILTLNDMVETDKLGSFFFLSISIVILAGLRQKTLSQKENMTS